MPTFHSGKTSTATVDNGASNAQVNLPTTRWSIEPSSEMVRFRNSLTGNFDIKEMTFDDATGTVDIDYDFAASPFATPPNLNAGGTIRNLRLFLNNTATAGSPPVGDHWFIPTALITRTPQSTGSAEKPTTQIAWTNSGPFYFIPSGGTEPS